MDELTHLINKSTWKINLMLPFKPSGQFSKRNAFTPSGVNSQT